MGTTWQDREVGADDDGDDSPTVVAFNGRVAIDLRDPIILVRTDPYAVEKMFLSILVKVAESGADDEVAGVFLRRWAAGTGNPPAVAAALSLAASRMRGSVNADALVTVDRWIAGLDLAPTRGRLHRVLRGRA